MLVPLQLQSRINILVTRIRVKKQTETVSYLCCPVAWQNLVLEARRLWVGLGHFQATVGLGSNGKLPSWQARPGQPAYLLYGISASVCCEVGNNKMLYFTMTPFLPSEVPDTWQTILVEKSPMPARVRSSANIMLPCLS